MSVERARAQPKFPNENLPTRLIWFFARAPNLREPISVGVAPLIKHGVAPLDLGPYRWRLAVASPHPHIPQRSLWTWPMSRYTRRRPPDPLSPKTVSANVFNLASLACRIRARQDIGIRDVVIKSCAGPLPLTHVGDARRRAPAPAFYKELAGFWPVSRDVRRRAPAPTSTKYLFGEMQQRTSTGNKRKSGPNKFQNKLK